MKVYVERKELKRKLMFQLERKRSVFLKAPKGYGKTTFLRHLSKELENSVYTMSRPRKYMLENIAEALEIKLKGERGEKRTIRLLKDILKKKREEDLQFKILIDEVEYITKLGQEAVKKLKRVGYTVVAAGTEKPDRLEFKEKIELGPLNDKQATELVREVLAEEYEEVPERIIRVIVRKASGSPEKLRNYAGDLVIAKRVDGLKIENRNKLHRLLNNLKNVSENKINLLPISGILGLASVFLALRYFFYGQEEYQLGYLFAMIAYMIYAIKRLK